MRENYWFNYCFDDLFEFEGSYSASREELGDEGVLYLHYGDMHTSSRNFVDVDNEYENLPRYKIKGTPKFLLNDGDLVFVDASEDYPGTCKTFLVKNKTNKPFVAGLHTFIARSKVDVVSNEFKKYLTEIPEVRRQIYKYVQGYKVYGINRDNLKKINVCLPNYDESLKIAKILDCWAKAVELQENKIKKLEEKKKALMQKLLKPKEDWQKKSLKDMIEFAVSGGTPLTTNADYYGGETVWISIDDMSKSKKYIYDSSRKLTSLGVDNSSAKILPSNVILFAMYASIGKCVITKAECCTSQAILGIKIRETYNTEFVYYYLSSIQQKLSKQGQTGTQSNLNKNMVLKISIPCPNLIYQEKIVKALSTIDKLIEVEECKCKFIKEQQRALMQKLLTGKVRVNG